MAGARFFGSIRPCTVIIAESITILSRLSARSINSVSIFSIMSLASSSALEAPNVIVRDINGLQRLLRSPLGRADEQSVSGSQTPFVNSGG